MPACVGRSFVDCFSSRFATRDGPEWIALCVTWSAMGLRATCSVLVFARVEAPTLLCQYLCRCSRSASNKVCPRFLVCPRRHWQGVAICTCEASIVTRRGPATSIFSKRVAACSLVGHSLAAGLAGGQHILPREPHRPRERRHRCLAGRAPLAFGGGAARLAGARGLASQWPW